MLVGIITSALTIIIDQISKYFIFSHLLEEFDYLKVSHYFSIVKAWNTGVSFSMFSGNGTIGSIILSIVALGIVACLFYWLKKEKSTFLQIAIGLIIGGALGNLIDRIRFGAVFDFLDFSISGYHWPAFNIADSAICIGAAMIIYDNIFIKKRSK